MKKIIAITLLFCTLWWYCYQSFNLAELELFLSHLKTYQLRTLSLFLIATAIGLLHVIPMKRQPRLFKILPFRWNVLTLLALFIYPMTGDFASRFGKITPANWAEFLALILPVFLMMTVLSLIPSPGENQMDSEERQERKAQLSKFLKAPHLRKSQSNESSNVSSIISRYGLLFAGLLMRIHTLGKITNAYGNELAIRPFMIFLIWLTCSLNREKFNSFSLKSAPSHRKNAKTHLSPITFSIK